MTAPTPGQRAAGVFWKQFVSDPAVMYERLNDRSRALWEAVAQAVLNDAFPGLREQVRLARQDRDQLRKHVLDQAAEYEAEAFRIAPPGAPEDPPDMADYIRAETLNVAAARLRKIAEPPS